MLDQSEAVVANVAITLSNVSTGLHRPVTTNERGDFDAPFMPLGDYQITAELAGFQRKILTGVHLQVDQTAILRIVLEPGAVTQTVEVTSAAPLLESQTSSLGQVIENKRIVDLPLNGHNPYMLGMLAGGATPFKGLNTNIPFIAGGGRHSANDILLDGVDNIRNFGGDVGRNGVAYIPSLDAVQEFKVKTNNFAAEYGRSAGYTVNATIKSGTNEFHGSVFEFLRNKTLDANNLVANFAGQPRAKFRQNQFGATHGGPVGLPGYDGRNRTFYFIDYEGTLIRQAAGSSRYSVAVVTCDHEILTEINVNASAMTTHTPLLHITPKSPPRIIPPKNKSRRPILVQEDDSGPCARGWGNASVYQKPAPALPKAAGARQERPSVVARRRPE